MGRKRSVEVEPNDNPTIVAIDPGGTTGWSVMTVHAEALVDGDVSILENILHWGHGQIVGDENAQASEILGLIDSWPGCCVLIEDFVLRTSNGSRDVLSPVRITAKIEYGLYLVGAAAFRQMPSEAMSVATDDRLKSWGFYERAGGMGHARDADRHALVWLRKCKQYEWMRRQCWPYLYGAGSEFFEGLVLAEGSDEDEELG